MTDINSKLKAALVAMEEAEQEQDKDMEKDVMAAATEIIKAMEDEGVSVEGPMGDTPAAEEKYEEPEGDAAVVALLKAQGYEAESEEPDESDVVAAAKVILKAMGEEGAEVAKEIEPVESNENAMEGMDDDKGMVEGEYDAEVAEAAIRAVRSLGFSNESIRAGVEALKADEDYEMPSEKMEEDLDELGDLVASYLQKHPSQQAATNLTSRLTASMNLSVMALAQRSQ